MEYSNLPEAYQRSPQQHPGAEAPEVVPHAATPDYSKEAYGVDAEGNPIYGWDAAGNPIYQPHAYPGSTGFREDAYPQAYEPPPQQAYQDGQHNAQYGAAPGAEGVPWQTDSAAGAAIPPARRKLLLIGGIVLILVIIGAVVGGVVGSRAHQSSQNASTDSTPTSSTALPSSTSASSSIPKPTSIAANSPLSAVSFPTTDDGSPGGKQNGYVIVLGFKDPKGGMHASIYATTWGSLASDKSPWSPTPQGITAVHPPADGPSMALAGFATASPPKQGTTNPIYSLELMVVYVNSTGFINGLKYIDTAASAGTQPEQIDDRGFSVRTGSIVAAYWPWFAFQDSTGMLNVANYLATTPYESTQLTTVATQGTKLVIVPLSTQYTKIIDSSYAVFYQAGDGHLAAVIPGNLTGGSSDYTQSWPSLSTFPKITLSRHASFSAFSISRSNGTMTDTVNTYMLYQDDSNHINQVWTDDGKTWQTSSPAALAVADNGTDISCLTPAASNSTYGTPLSVAPQTNMTRCYYQRAGSVVEVQLKDADWVELGTVPMP